MVAVYEPTLKPEKYRLLIVATLTNLACLYRLDYHFEIDKKNWKDGPDNWTSDLFYFRATEQTEIDGKAFRKLVGDIFSKATSFDFLNAEVFFQLQKELKHYPFPNEYVRPLNYPFAEHYKDGQKQLTVYADAIRAID